MKICKLTGAGHYFPEKIMTSEELEELIGFDNFNMRKGMTKIISGVDTRRIAAKEQNCSDFAIMAGKMALERAGLEPKDIDILIYAAITQDYYEPATANVIQYKLGADNAKCFDVKNACNSFITAMEVANMYIEAEKAEHILIVSGEVLSRFIRKKVNSLEELKKINATFSVGDGGGAVVLSAVDSDDSEKAMLSRFKTYGEYWNDGIIWGGGSIYPHDPDKLYLQNQTNEMLKVNFDRGVEFYKETFEQMGICNENVSLFVPSQITKYLIVKLSEILGLDKHKVVDQISLFGNVGAASIPIGISRAIENQTIVLGSGQRIVCFGAANGFNAGVLSFYV